MTVAGRWPPTLQASLRWWHSAVCRAPCCPVAKMHCSIREALCYHSFIYPGEEMRGELWNCAEDKRSQGEGGPGWLRAWQGRSGSPPRSLEMRFPE